MRRSMWSIMASRRAYLTRALNHLIRRVCRGSLLPGQMPLGLRGYRSLLCVVTQSYAVLYGQNQTTGKTHGSGGGEPVRSLAGLTADQLATWPSPGPRADDRLLSRSF